ncbi:MAG: ABC-F family ATP-binding cassette domain-containing protein [Eubacteriales bacterium]|nr:ABC-F family ATP-binding cassette domain-containing protein [Eubacteriales bacterium]
MNAVRITDLTIAFGTDVIIDKAELSVEHGEKIGIIGRNGAGKTTLAKALLGQKGHIESGEAAIASSLSVGYLSQHDVVSSDKTVYEEMQSAAGPVLALEARLRETEEKLAAATDEAERTRLYDLYASLSDRYADVGGYELDSRISGILRGVGFEPEQFGAVSSTLSGGQQTRLALARILFSRPDVLLLDEPTNHLDIAGCRWLTAHLKNYHGTLLLITHDRYMLDTLCDRICEILNSRLYCYNGNYSAFLTQRAERMLTAQREWEKQQKYIEKQQEIIRTYRAFNREKSVRAADSRAHMLEKLERVRKPEDDTAVSRIRFTEAAEPNDVPLEIDSLAFGYDAPLLTGASLRMGKRERAVILGDNGTGKTTLFRLITGELAPESGTIRVGNKMRIGYLEQQRLATDSTQTVLDSLFDSYPKTDPGQLRQVLAAFCFTGDDVFKPLKALSGGERARLELARLSLKPVNLLLLDEPTNHLDLMTREALEEALLSFGGVILAVSHDIYFINKIARKLYLLEGGKIASFEGNYDDLAAFREREAAIAAGKTPAAPVNRTAAAKARRAEEEKKRERRARLNAVRQLELEIGETEEAILRCETELCDLAGGDIGAIREANKRYEALKAHLADLYEKWTAAEEEA